MVRALTFLEERKSMAWETWKEKPRRSSRVKTGESLSRSWSPCWSGMEIQFIEVGLS